MKLTVMSDAECQALDKRELSQAKKLDAEIDRIIGDIANSGLQLAMKLYEMRRNDMFRKLGFKSMKQYVASKQLVAQRALSKSYLSMLLDAGYVYKTICDDKKFTNCELLPVNAGQCRAMANLSNLQIPQVWQAVVEKSQQENKPITAAMVSAVKRKLMPEKAKEPKAPKTRKPSSQLTQVRKLLDDMSELDLRKLFLELQERLK